MSKRLQVLLEEAEYREIQAIAKRRRMTVSEWVRRALRASRKEEPSREAEKKLAAVRAAARHELPTADIGTMLDEISSGYSSETDT